MKTTHVRTFPTLPADWCWSPPLRHAWRKAVASQSLIPLDVALIYLRRERAVK